MFAEMRGKISYIHMISVTLILLFRRFSAKDLYLKKDHRLKITNDLFRKHSKFLVNSRLIFRGILFVFSFPSALFDFLVSAVFNLFKDGTIYKQFILKFSSDLSVCLLMVFF
jgi:hypothetical protein